MFDKPPTKTEMRLLELGYDRFLNLYQEIMSDNFWNEKPDYRLGKIKDVCSVYSELLKYPQLNAAISNAVRPNYKLVGKDFVTFLRNLLLHFPYFKEWSDITFDKDLLTAFEPAGSIDRFLSKTHPSDIKYRFWDPNKKSMTYVEVSLNTEYSNGSAIKLTDIISEQDGVKFLCIFMFEVLMTKIETDT